MASFSIFRNLLVFHPISLKFGTEILLDIFERKRNFLAVGYSTYTERRSASENSIIDNTHCIVFSF